VDLYTFDRQQPTSVGSTCKYHLMWHCLKLSDRIETGCCPQGSFERCPHLKIAFICNSTLPPWALGVGTGSVRVSGFKTHSHFNLQKVEKHDFARQMCSAAIKCMTFQCECGSPHLSSVGRVHSRILLQKTPIFQSANMLN